MDDHDWQPVVTNVYPWWDMRGWFKPAKLMMRRREKGEWIYRTPTDEEEFREVSDKAW